MATRSKHPPYILNCLPSPKPEKNWTLETAAAAGLTSTSKSTAAAVANIDLRAAWWKVGDQGNTGSCVGWGTADAVLRWHFVKAGRLAKTERLSTRYIWMASKETDQYTTRPTSFVESDGTWLTAALGIAQKFGVVTDKVLPFKLGGQSQMYTGSANTFYALAAQRRIASYFNLGRDLAKWRHWLATQGPILTRLDVDDAFMQATSAKGRLDSYTAHSGLGGHCVALVGYVNGRFIVRNSWGTGWGDKGFAHAADSYAQPAFTEAFGVVL
ncbi:MAG: C1 family peptidase [Pseudomonadota bacterium]